MVQHQLCALLWVSFSVCPSKFLQQHLCVSRATARHSKPQLLPAANMLPSSEPSRDFNVCLSHLPAWPSKSHGPLSGRSRAAFFVIKLQVSHVLGIKASWHSCVPCETHRTRKMTWQNTCTSLEGAVEMSTSTFALAQNFNTSVLWAKQVQVCLLQKDREYAFNEAVS